MRTQRSALVPFSDAAKVLPAPRQSLASYRFCAPAGQRACACGPQSARTDNEGSHGLVSPKGQVFRDRVWYLLMIRATSFLVLLEFRRASLLGDRPGPLRHITSDTGTLLSKPTVLFSGNGESSITGLCPFGQGTGRIFSQFQGRTQALDTRGRADWNGDAKADLALSDLTELRAGDRGVRRAEWLQKLRALKLHYGQIISQARAIQALMCKGMAFAIPKIPPSSMMKGEALLDLFWSTNR